MGVPIAVFAAAELDQHRAPLGHPEHPGRLDASLAGIAEAGLLDAVSFRVPRLATADEISVAHTVNHIAMLRALCARGGGDIDGDTYVAPGSWTTATRAVGAVLDAVDDVPVYARVDLVDVDGVMLLMELELIEPELFFQLAPEAVDRLADLLAAG